MAKGSGSGPSHSNPHQQEKASWNQPNAPSPSTFSSSQPPSTLSSHPLQPPAYYPRFSPIHIYNLYNKIPDEIIEILHRLDQKKQTEAQRGFALTDLEKKLNDVLVWRWDNRKIDEEVVPGMEALIEKAVARRWERKWEESEELTPRGRGGPLSDAFEDDSWVESIGPLWLHHLPSLLLTPDLTTQTLSVHSQLLKLHPNFVADSIPSLCEPFSRRRNAVGSLFVASAVAEFNSPFFHSSTSSITSLSKVHLESVIAYLLWSIFTPGKLWESIDESDGCLERAVARKNRKGRRLEDEVEGAELGKKEEQARAKEAEQDEEQRKIEERIRAGGLITVRKLMRELPNSDASALLQRLLSDRRFWTCLSPNWISGEKEEPLGLGRPEVRKAGWEILKEAVVYQSDLVELNLRTISINALIHCWNETDEAVVDGMWQTLSFFLKQFPQSWLLTPSVVSHSDRKPYEFNPWTGTKFDDSYTPKAFDGFLSYLRTGCRGLPLASYPFVVDVVDSLPLEIFPLTTPSLETLFDALWSAHSSLPLSAVNALLVAIQACNTILFEKRMDGGGDQYPDARQFAADQLERIQREAGQEFRGGGAGLIGDQLSGLGERDDDIFEYGEEDYNYDDEEEEDDEEEDGEEIGEVEGDRLSEGSGVEEREEDWEGGERRVVRGEDLERELGNPPSTLKALRVTSNLPLASLPSLVATIACSPSLRLLDLSHLTNSSSESVVPLLEHFLHQSTTSPIHHLSLNNSCLFHNPTSSSISLLETSLVNLLTLNRKGLEYLDLRGTSTFTVEETLEDLVDVVEDSNRTIQMIWFDPRQRWRNTSFDYLRDRLNDALEKNRARRKLAHSSALGLLPSFRAMLHASNSTSTEVGRGLGKLPLELVREILSYSRASGLSRRQVGRVMDWAGSRETLVREGRREGSSREFLEEVDCWRFEEEL